MKDIQEKQEIIKYLKKIHKYRYIDLTKNEIQHIKRIQFAYKEAKEIRDLMFYTQGTDDIHNYDI